MKEAQSSSLPILAEVNVENNGNGDDDDDDDDDDEEEEEEEENSSSSDNDDEEDDEEEDAATQTEKVAQESMGHDQSFVAALNAEINPNPNPIHIHIHDTAYSSIRHYFFFNL